MKNLSRAELEKAANFDGSKAGKTLRPKDAATLIILEGDPGNYRILMGRRHMRHKFMPGLFVFPGGRVDKDDGRIASHDALEPQVVQRLLAGLRGRPSLRRTKALAMAAIRETYEEAGLYLGEKTPYPTNHADWQGFADAGVTPSLNHLRLVARAITPPGRPRRFDTWFFITHAKHIAHRTNDGLGPSGELQDLHWLSFADARKLELPLITKTVIDEVDKRLTHDPDLNPSTPIPFYHLKRATFVREEI